MLFRAFICKQNDFSCQGEFCAGFAARSGEGVEGTTVPGQGAGCGLGEEKPSTALVETPAPGAGCTRGREQRDVLLSPLSLLSSSAEILLQHLSTEKVCLVSAEMSVARWSCSGREGEEEEVEDGGRCCPGCAGLSWAPREEGSCHTGQDQAL